jgi:hypothetical protein
MEQLTLGEVINGGIGVVLLFLLIKEQKARETDRTERNAMTERVFRYLEEARDKRHQMAQAIAASRLGTEHNQETKGGD